MRKVLPKHLKETERAVLMTVMFQAGILPLEDAQHDQRRVLEQMDPAEARKLKRKFRKVWRKLAKQEGIKSASKTVAAATDLKTRQNSYMERQYGKGKNNPSRHERQQRKKLVQEHFYGELVRPILDRFEKDERKIASRKPNDSAGE